jgi:hypothetical protein
VGAPVTRSRRGVEPELSVIPLSARIAVPVILAIALVLAIVVIVFVAAKIQEPTDCGL